MRAHPKSVVDYLSRIGAERLNFRKAMVKTHVGEYYIEKALIKFNEDGSVECDKKEYAPTADEAEKIKEDLTAIVFPKAIHAGSSDRLWKLVKGRPTLYEFYDLTSHDIIMVQERIDPAFAKGNQKYRPWVMMDDGEWEPAEPDGSLPFWKPKDHQPGRRIMIHEGAKAAEYVDRMLREHGEKWDHPWARELAGFEHWGMIGGALAPHRSDYDELHKAKPFDVIYACDRDPSGESALVKVSKKYAHSMKGVIFGKKFPEGWDMADEVPKRLFSYAGRYLGPKISELMVPATYATYQIPNPSGKGRPITLLSEEFAREWIHVVTPEVYLHNNWPNRTYTSSEFDNKVRPFSDVNETSKLLKGDNVNKADSLRYIPGDDPGLHTMSERYVNTYTPSPIDPEPGDATPWIEFMEYLIPDETERHEVLKWCATLVSKPSHRMLYGLLLISEMQGIGKGTLGEKILGPLVGKENTSFPTESQIVDSNYNYWIAHHRFAVIHEIYAGNSSKAYNKMKSIITDKSVDVEKKYQAIYTIENWLHVLACSNSLRALKLDNEDRRWFVPKLTEKLQPEIYWENFLRWLDEEGGLNIIRWWCDEFVKNVNNVIFSRQRAPDSLAKQQMVFEAYSAGQKLVHNLLSSIKIEIDKGKLPPTTFVIDTDLVNAIRNEIYEGRYNDKLEKPMTVRGVAKGLGWKCGDTQAQISGWSKSTFGGRILSLNEDVAKKSPGQLSDLGLSPLDLSKFIGL